MSTVHAQGSVRLQADSLQQEQAAFDSVDDCVQSEMRQQNTPGVSLAIALDGRQVYTKTYGVKHSAQGGEIGPDTYFRINSTTKTMTGAAVVHALENELVDVHAPVMDYLPDLTLRPPWQASALSIHHLMSGQSGLPASYPNLGATPVVARVASNTSLQDWTGLLRHMHLFAPPESFFNYSSAGISLAAAAVEQATGIEYAEYVEQKLWRPAGMERITMDPEDVISDGDYAMGHMWGQHFGPEAWAEPFSAPSGGAYSTPTELIKWALMLAEDGREVLSPESVSLMTEPHAAVSNVPIATYTGYGYGVFVEDFRRLSGGEEVRVNYHPGNGRGYATELFWTPETGFAVAILSNTPTGMNRSALCALREVAGLVRLPVDRSPPAAETLNRYTGSYGLVDTMGNTYTARVWEEEGGLQIEYSDWNLLPTIGELAGQRPMTHRHGEVFRYDGYGNLTARFVSVEEDDPHARYMEHLSVVGQRAGRFPEEIRLQGGSCERFEIRPDQDGLISQLSVHGLNPVYSEQDVPARQDSPESPASASIKIDLPAAGEVAFLMAYHWPENDDDLDLYLMRDGNGDGEFEYPSERVDELRGGGLGFIARTPLPAGDYQLWIHGRQVNGASSTFNYDVVMVAGDALRLEDPPENLRANRDQTLQVCADPVSGEAPLLGLLTYELEDGLRVVRVPVKVLPGGMGIFLPALRNEISDPG